MKSIVIVNPVRYTGSSYLTFIKYYLQDYNLIGIWTTNKIKETYSNTIPNFLHVVIDAEEYSIDELVDKLKQYEPKAFLVGDDSAFYLSDLLQNIFFPTHSNDPSLYEIRIDKGKYLTYLKNKGLVNTSQKLLTREILSEIENKKYVIKPPAGAGNENVFIVNSKDQILSILESVNETFIIQEFIEGEEYCVEMSSFNGIHKCTMASIYKGNFLVDNISPWREENELISEDDPNLKTICEYVREILTCLGIKLGLTWTQVKINNGVPNLIEINFRSQGHGHYTFIYNSTGNNYVIESLKAYMKSNKLSLAQEDLMYKKIGNFNKICVNNKIERFIDSFKWIENNQIKSNMLKSQYASFPNNLKKSKNFKTVIGMILLENNDLTQYNIDMEKINNWKITVES